MSTLNSQHTKNEAFKYSFRLIDIKDNKECWFQCLHGYSVLYKTPLQIINNQFIIDRLSPNDACIVGVICGEMYNFYIKDSIVLNRPLQKHKIYKTDYKFQLISISRNKSIEYIDCITERQYEKNIIDLAQDKNTISDFTSTDAFYIGFLAGIELYKIKNNLNMKPRNQPKLKLVYSRSMIELSNLKGL